MLEVYWWHIFFEIFTIILKVLLCQHIIYNQRWKIEQNNGLSWPRNNLWTGQFLLSIYCKANFSGVCVYTHIGSFLAYHYKVDMSHSTVYRRFQICSNLQSSFRITYWESFKSNWYLKNLSTNTVKYFKKFNCFLIANEKLFLKGPNILLPQRKSQVLECFHLWSHIKLKSVTIVWCF